MSSRIADDCPDKVAMSIRDSRCDLCAVVLRGVAPPDVADPAPGMGVRFAYHPGDVQLRDDSGLVCASCWRTWSGGWGPIRDRSCATCGLSVTRTSSLHLRRHGTTGVGWQLCARHAALALNELRTVEPKFDPETFRLPLDRADA